MEKHKHTQAGYVIIISLAITMILGSYFTKIDELESAAYVIFIFLLICLILFYSLTITITENFLKIRFGVGIISKQFPLNEITSYKIVKNPWYYGWGIHLTPHGCLYNVSGFYAIEITTKTGKKYRIGTDDPERLENILKQTLIS